MEENYAGNIIVNLASLPDFLRKPILKKRMAEFFTMPDDEKIDIIKNALDAGSTIPFPNFSKLFKTWLEVLAAFPDEQREALCLAYVKEIIRTPQKLINFNLDGILEIFLMLDEEKYVIARTVKRIIDSLSPEEKKMILVLVPDNAKKHLGI